MRRATLRHRAVRSRWDRRSGRTRRRRRGRRCCTWRRSRPTHGARHRRARRERRRWRCRRRPSSVAAETARIRFSVSVPVLSVQMTLVDPSVSTALSRLTSAPRRARTRTPSASASVMVGSRPSGTFATMRPTANTAASEKGRPASMPRGRNARPMTTATTAMSRATRRTWCSSGLSSCSGRCDERGDPAELGVHAGREHEGPRGPARAVRAAEHEVARLEERDRRVDQVGGAVHGHGFAGQRRRVDLERARQQACVGGDLVSFGDLEDVAGHELARRDRSPSTVAYHRRPLREVGRQGFDCPFGFLLLHERERRVRGDHGDDRRGDRRRSRCPGEHRGGGEQHRQRMRELPNDLAPPRAIRGPLQLVGAVGDEAPFGLALRQPCRARSEVA